MQQTRRAGDGEPAGRAGRRGEAEPAGPPGTADPIDATAGQPSRPTGPPPDRPSRLTGPPPDRPAMGRSIGLGLVAVVLIAAMVALGLWQLSVFDDRQRQAGQQRVDDPPVPLAEVLGPDDPFPSDGFGRPVVAEGRYDAEQQVYVVGLEGHDAAYAVATPLVTDNGSAILVVRGASEAPRAPAPVGPVTVTGVLQPSTAAGTGVGANRVAEGVRIPALVQEVGRDLYAGYVVLTSSEPAEALAPVAPRSSRPSLLDGLRNLAYALQWWLFAGYVAFMWVKIARPFGPP